MALEDFSRGFQSTFPQGARQGQQAYQFQAKQEQQQEQFERRQSLREKAQKMKKRVQQQKLERLALQMEQARKKFPHELDQAKAEARGADAQADLRETRADNAPERMQAEIDRLNQQIDTSAAQATAARSRADAADTRDAMNEFRLGRARDAVKRQEQVRQDTESINQATNRQSQPLPKREADRGGFSIDDVPRVLHNYTTGPALTGLASFLNPNASYSDYSGVFMGDDRPPVSDENRQKGQAALRAELGTVGAIEQKFQQAAPEARSPQAATNALKRIGRVEGQLRENTYGFGEEERKQMLQRIQRQKKYFSRYVPREDPMAGQLRKAAQTSMDEGEIPSAVKALNALRKFKTAQQPQQQSTDPLDMLQ